MNYDDMCEMLRILTIPLGPMAADAITALQARVADLTADILEDGKLRKIAYDQRDKAEADLAAAQRAYEITRQDCWNLTEKVIPNIRQDLAAARALLIEANEILSEAIVCGPKLRQFTPLRNLIGAALAQAKGDERNRLRDDLAAAQDKALRFDLDAANITRRDEDLSELARLRATLNDHLQSESAETMRADRAEAQLAAARADAERYRWLRNEIEWLPPYYNGRPEPRFDWVQDSDTRDLDAFIDAALAGEKK